MYFTSATISTTPIEEKRELKGDVTKADDELTSQVGQNRTENFQELKQRI